MFNRILFIPNGLLDKLRLSLFVGKFSVEATWLRVGALNAEDPGSNPRLGQLNEFVVGVHRGKVTTLCK